MLIVATTGEMVAAMVSEYPRAVRAVIELLRRVRAHYELKHRTAPLSASDARRLLAAFARFRVPYVALVLRFGTINAMTSVGAASHAM